VKPPTPVVLSQPFPSQHQAQLVIHDQPSPSTTSYVLMCTGDSKKNNVSITTRAKYYSPSKEKVDNFPPSLVQPPPSTSPPNGPLHLERPGPDTVLFPPPKGVVQKSTFNPHAHAAQNYSIVEDLEQAPSAMSALEVLQSCPSQQKALLKAIGGIDPTDMNLIIFDLEDHIPRLPPQLAFQIQVVVENKNIYRTIIDKGASRALCLLLVGKPLALLPSPNHTIHLRPSMVLVLNPTVFFPHCLLRWKENRSMSRSRSLMHLLIITSYLVIAGLIPCMQLCLPFSMCYVSHTKERSLLLTNWPFLILIPVLEMYPLSRRHLLGTRMSMWVF
jgi:hypothetical protein